MNQTENLSGRRFGRLVAKRYIGRNSNHRQVWLCVCDCGAETNVEARYLKKSRTKSCGCYSREVSRAQRGGLTHGLSGTGAFNSWVNMLSRCESPTDKQFHNYGGRGIQVCDRWHDFANFFADMGHRPEGMSLDRLDADGPYEPGNCRWATSKQQGRNKRNCRFAVINGESKAVAEWAEFFGINAQTVHSRLRRCWTAERALTEPLKQIGHGRDGAVSLLGIAVVIGGA